MSSKNPSSPAPQLSLNLGATALPQPPAPAEPARQALADQPHNPQGPLAGTFYIVDGSAYIYRAYFAIRNLSNSKGMPTNAIFGFTQMLKRLISETEPDYLAVTFDAFDAEERNFRKILYPDYKANRSEMPEDLQIQVPYFRKVVEALNIPIMECAGVEADDLIATATDRALALGLKVVIVSADKDLMQLIGEDVVMVDTMRERSFSEADVIERFGVGPKQVRDVLALAGDTADNVPGVPGIGEKTGGKLIAEFSSLENLLANLDQIPGKRREVLRENAHLARLSLELVTLRHDCEVAFDPDQLRLKSPDLERMTALFHELDFQGTLKDLRTWMTRHGWLKEGEMRGKTVARVDAQGQMTTTEGRNYRTVTTIAGLREVVGLCAKADLFAFDLETTSVEAMDARIVGVALGWAPGEAAYIPVAHAAQEGLEQLGLSVVLEHLMPLVGPGAPRRCVGQHCKYEWLVLQNYGVEFSAIACDTMLMSYLIDPTRGSHSLDALAFELLGHRTITFSEVAGSGKQQVTFDQVPVDRATIYAAEDADVTLQLARAMQGPLREQALEKLHDELEVPLSRVLGIMERHGILVDRAALGELSVLFEVELARLQTQIDAIAGGPLNPNSPTQLREVLFDRLGLPVKKRTKTGASTDQSVLEQLAELHALPQLILDFRSFAKLKGTYVDALPLLIRPDTGRVHTDFNQAVAATGRLSSSNPNLQNIPIRTAQGREIRRAFVAEPGHLLLSADYSQIELRIMAHMAQDPVLLEAYQTGQDIHALTAAGIFGVGLEEVSGAQRRIGKTINFGVMYGMGARRLARELEISQQEAKLYIDRYFERYHVVARFFEELVSRAENTGCTETLFGRKRQLADIHTKGGTRAFAERAAINTPIQGTAADIIKMAMVDLQGRIEAENLPMRMLLQVHDELVFEVREDFVQEARKLVKERMEAVVQLDAPLEVEVGVGANWLDAK